MSSFFPSACAIASAQIVFPVPRPREVEDESESRRVALAEPPAAEDQAVVADLAERLVQRVARGGRQDDVVERSLGDDRLDRAAAREAPREE